MREVRDNPLPIALLTIAIFVLTPCVVRIYLQITTSPGDGSREYIALAVAGYSAYFQIPYLIIGIVAGVILRRHGRSEWASGILIGTAVGIALGFISCLIAAVWMWP